MASATGRVKSRHALDYLEVRMHSGPLPAPETLQSYNLVLPDGAERMFRQMELNGEHRRRMELKALRGYNFRGWFNLFMAALVVLSLAGIGTYLAMSDKSTAAVAVFTTTIVGIASAFLAVRKNQKTEE